MPSSTRSDQTTGVQGVPVLDEGKHTPTPWTFDGNCGGYISQSGERIARAYALNDAAFIVRAVNCHDELVEALSNARSILVAFAGDPRQTIQQDGSIVGDEMQAALLDCVDAALSKALGTDKT